MDPEDLLENLEYTRIIEVGYGIQKELHLVRDTPNYSLTNPAHYLLPSSDVPGGYPPKTFVTDHLDSFLKDLTDTEYYRHQAKPQIYEPLFNRQGILNVESESNSLFQISLSRHPLTGELTGYHEEANILPPTRDVCGEDIASLLCLNNSGGLLTCPPGFKEGIDFSKNIDIEANNEIESIKAQDIFITDHFELDWLGITVEKESLVENIISENQIDVDIDTALQDAEKNITDSLMKVIKPHQKIRKRNIYTITEDCCIPIRDFNDKLPIPAITFSFELDIFQKKAILLLENHKNVFVAAHTSAGKTVIAEYAVALSKKHKAKAIYTSPIKALSNQKFRDFKQRFGDVGIITGDVQLDTKAQCLIMTTEILRSLLYKNDNIVRDVEWVIFDEVHYISNVERGVVWEEVLIMLPKDIGLVMLSATVPNIIEFAEWIGHTKKTPIHVVTTNHRPVPLKHFLYTGNSTNTSNQLFALAYSREQGLVNNGDGYREAASVLKERNTAKQIYKGSDRNTQIQRDRGIWQSLINSLEEKDRLPLIAFLFSRNKCDELGCLLAKSVSLTSSAEQGKIYTFFQKSISRLKPCDRVLPQIEQLRVVLKQGVGIHHSGILPILKEIVEILFQQGLVKVLFATETFAIGVNMPARTVAFDTIEKYDGSTKRLMQSGEYIQMSGRAGRRGLDDMGFVIIIVKRDLPDLSVFNKMILSQPLQLTSQFRLRYSMILNLQKAGGCNLAIEDLIRKSFAETDAAKNYSTHIDRVSQLEIELNTYKPINDPHCANISEYYLCCGKIQELKRKLINIALNKCSSKILSPGRVFLIRVGISKYTYGCLATCEEPSRDFYHTTGSAKKLYTFLILKEKDFLYDEFDFKYIEPYRKELPLMFPENIECLDIFETKGEHIVSICQARIANFDEIKMSLADLKRRKLPRYKEESPDSIILKVTNSLKRLLLTKTAQMSAKEMNLNSLDYVDMSREVEVAERIVSTFECENSPQFLELFVQISQKLKIEEELKQLRYLTSDESLVLLPEYKQRVDVLKSLNYLDDGMNIQLKGRIACGFSVNELILTELIVENFFSKFSPEESVALLSCIVFTQKNTPQDDLEDKLEQGRDEIRKIAIRIVYNENEAGIISNDGDDVLNHLNFGLVMAVHHWATGTIFADIMKLTEVHEGIIVRCIQQLNEMCRNITEVAKVIGNQELADKMKMASDCIKRDIIFTGSLYIK